MTKLKGLLLTEGMHGMISQVEGLAKALDLDFIHEKIELNNFWKLIPPKITLLLHCAEPLSSKNEIDFIASLNVKGININHTMTHLKKFRVSGGTSNKVANLPIIKFPDQNKAAKVRKV